MAKCVVLLLLVSLCFSPVFAYEVVKLSGSGLCHDTDSQWYKRTTRFTAYKSMQHCLSDGGKAYSGYISHPKTALTDGYHRDWFPHWLDEDGDCRDTRAETLINQSEVPVAFTDTTECQVKSGRWYDPYTGRIFTDDNDLDIDHIVPLKWAYEHGADKWSENIRAAFANDTLNVIAVSLSANRSKGAKGPTEWMPLNQNFRCQYLKRFQIVTQKYQLAFTAIENRFLSRQLLNCQRPG